jgi:thiamine biosynthesis lipoprotein
MIVSTLTTCESTCSGQVPEARIEKGSSSTARDALSELTSRDNWEINGQENEANEKKADLTKNDDAETKDSKLTGYQYQFPAMGTLVSIICYSESEATATAAFQAAEKEVQRIQAVLSDYVSDSETRQLTQKAVGQFASVSNTLGLALMESDKWFRLSEGSFDASLGQLTYLWRQHRRRARAGRESDPPTKEEVHEALSHGGWQNVELKQTDSQKESPKPCPAAKLEEMSTVSARFLVDELRLDFGGIGKGIAVDAAFEKMQEMECSVCLVNMSGNIRVGPAPPNRDGWRVEIAPIEKGGKPLRRIVVSDVALATSGDLWQFAVIDGVRRSHILNPKTGWGIPGPAAATVLAETATDADAAATVAVLNTRDWINRNLARLPVRGILKARRTETDQLEIDTWGELNDAHQR